MAAAGWGRGGSPRVAALRWVARDLGCRGWVEVGQRVGLGVTGKKRSRSQARPGRVRPENKCREIQNKHGSTGRLERWGQGVGLPHLQLQPRKMLPEERCEEEGELTASLPCLPLRGEGAER